MLVALLLLLVLTVRTAGVSLVSSISSTLDIVFMMSINNLGLSLDNVRVVVDLFMLLSAMSDDNILTLLNMGYIYYYVIVNKTFFMILLLWSFVRLVILL